MSVASSIPCVRISNPSSSCSSLPSSSSSVTCSTSSCVRFSITAKSYSVTIRSSQAEGPIRRPVAPPLREPSPPSAPTPLKPVPPSPPSSPVAPPPKPAAQVKLEDKNVITLEFQRQKAKELQEYFKQKKLEKTDQGPFFGFLGKNEIANGR